MAKDGDFKYADFDIAFEKKIISFKHCACVRKIYNILKEQNFDTIILNTSLAAWIVRRAIKRLKNKPNVINIVHGYLFDEKSSFVKKFGYVRVEKHFKNVTNSVVVMNNEDLDIVKTYKLAKDHVVKIEGMGIDGERFNKTHEKKYDVKNNPRFSFIGELSARKNQLFLIKFIEKLKKFGFEPTLNLIGWGVQNTEWNDTYLGGSGPHNLWLMLLLQGGYCLCISFVAIVIYVIKHALRETNKVTTISIIGLCICFTMSLFEVYNIVQIFLLIQLVYYSRHLSIKQSN